jgi:hypothetical protein
MHTVGLSSCSWGFIITVAVATSSLAGFCSGYVTNLAVSQEWVLLHKQLQG